MKLIQEICLWVCAIAGCGVILAGAAWVYWYAFDQLMRLFHVHIAFKDFLVKSLREGKYKRIVRR